MSWNDTHRVDGLRVVQGLDAVWYILPRHEHHVVDQCPTCDRPLTCQLTAMTVADRIVPLPKGNA